MQSEGCPLCGKRFAADKIEEHVNICLNSMDEGEKDEYQGNGKEELLDPMDEAESEMADREYALRLIAEEEMKRKKEEMENQRLLEEMLDREKFQQVESLQYSCPGCNKSQPIENMFYLDVCTHMFCKKCLHSTAMTKVNSKQCSRIQCLNQDCNTPFSQRDLKELLSESELEQYTKYSMDELVDNDDSFVRCPNTECGNVMERLVNAAEKITKETGPDGKALSKEAIEHRNQYRLRCRECSTEFCSHCSGTPYHLGFTCEQFTKYSKAQHCRFCNEELKEVSVGGSKALSKVCNSKECKEKKALSCTKMLPCDHCCIGIKGETKCIPCLDETCNKDDGSQKLDDYCNICWVDDLKSAPCILLDCGHVFHFECVKSKIASGWSGYRISFGFLDCALCKQQMSHVALKDVLKPWLDLLQQVKEKAVARFHVLKLEDTPEVKDRKSPFFKSPEKYSMYRFSYFKCFKCKKPYYGGERACEANQRENFDPKELVCGGCSDPTGKATCETHGNEYIEYKCKFCCNVAIWFCWGNTHFCEECHKKASTIAQVAKDKLPKCTCTIKHPPNGEEFSLGCGLCTSDAS